MFGGRTHENFWWSVGITNEQRYMFAGIVRREVAHVNIARCEYPWVLIVAIA